VTLRNGNSIISTDFTEDTIDNYYNDAYLIYCQTIWQLFWAFGHCRINTICIHCR